MRSTNAVAGSFFGLLGLLGSIGLPACADVPLEEVGSHAAALCTTECVSGTLSGDALLTPVDRTHALRSDWAPVTIPLPEGYRSSADRALRATAGEKFKAMVDAAGRENVTLSCVSGYRSFAVQCSLFSDYAATNGCEQANTFSAHAGHSEHQLGTVCDIGVGGGFIQAGDAGDRWLTAHAREYGFANSYPNTDRALNGGYIHEPWHYRYIGVRAAAALTAKEASLGAGTRLAVSRFIDSLTPAERAALEETSATPPAPTPTGSGSAAPPLPPSATPDCSTIPFEGRCTGAVLEYCQAGVYRRVDCAAKTDGRTRCGEDPRPEIANNCITP